MLPETFYSTVLWSNGGVLPVVIMTKKAEGGDDLSQSTTHVLNVAVWEFGKGSFVLAPLRLVGGGCLGPELTCSLSKSETRWRRSYEKRRRKF